MRELTRYRTSLIEERSTEVNRLQKVLEGANIKLSSVATDIAGVSGRQILAALVVGSKSAAAMAELAKGRLRDKIPQLEEALRGSFGPHQRFMVARQLAHIDFLDESIERLDREVAERMRPFEEIIVRLDEITGIGRRAAEVILAQIGVDMSRFPTAKHLASWAGMAPGSNESGGKRKSSRTRKGNSALRRILVQAAHAAGHSKNTYLGAQFRRVAARRGKKRAAVAVGHSILVIAYNIIKHGTTYSDLGGNYFDLRDREAVKRRLVSRLKALGYEVTLEPTKEAA
ncbi:MAG: IS110 family transposase [Chloroflexi bacterium]|nr:IS110 family transposase [Chloroflexota bacterium]